MSQGLPGIDPEALALVDNRDEPGGATVAAVPVPGKEGEGAALAGRGIEVAADILCRPTDIVFVNGSEGSPATFMQRNAS